MNRRQAARGRDLATRALAYRAWFVSPSEGAIPAIGILSDPRLQRREQDRQLRRAQVGLFDTVAAVGGTRIASTF